MIFITGGYVSLPVILAGRLWRRPIVLQESDAAMGLANRITARFATRVLSAFPDVYHSPKTTWVGAPVRQEITKGEPQRGWELTKLAPGKPVVLVMGGSLGAQSINDLIPQVFSWIRQDLQMVHITGAGKVIPFFSRGYVQFPYLEEDLKDVYAIADFIVTRAGSNALAEIALLQKPNFVIPLPGSAQGNQQENAAYFAQAGASIVLDQAGLTAQQLGERLLGLLRNPQKQKAMRQALGKLATPHAAEKIATILLNA